MKVKVLEESGRVFEPVTLEIVIESEQELCDWWLRLNAAGSVVDKAQDIDYFKHKASASESDEDLFKELTKLCKQKGLFIEPEEIPD